MTDALTYVHPKTGVVHGLGCKPAKRWKTGAMRTADDVMPVYDRSEIIKACEAAGGCIELPFPFAPNNQGGTPNCWDFSAVQMAEATINLMDGSLSVLDCSLGPIITGNMDGGGIEDLWIQVGKVYGFPSAADMGTDPLVVDSNNNPGIITSMSRLPANWKDLAAKRMGVEMIECPSVEALASGVLNKHPGNLGVDWQGGGHAIGCILVALPTWVAKLGGRPHPHHGGSDDLYFGTPSTWGANWSSGGEFGSFPGRPGWYLLGESQCSAAWSGPTFGAYANCGIRDNTVGTAA